MLLRVTKTNLLKYPRSQSKSLFHAGATYLVNNAWHNRLSLDLNFPIDNQVVITVILENQKEKIPKKLETICCCTAWHPGGRLSCLFNILVPTCIHRLFNI